MKKTTDFKKLVLGNAGRKNLKTRKKKGNWDVMYGGTVNGSDKDMPKKKKNFWVDKDIFFKQEE
jgi:hypothetical protein